MGNPPTPPSCIASIQIFKTSWFEICHLVHTAIFSGSWRKGHFSPRLHFPKREKNRQFFFLLLVLSFLNLAAASAMLRCLTRLKQQLGKMKMWAVLPEPGCCQGPATLFDTAETAIRQNENVCCPSWTWLVPGHHQHTATTHKGVHYRLKYATQMQQQRPKLPMVTLTWHECKNNSKVRELHQRYIL